MTKRINAIRGMHDILPSQIHCWHFIENTVRQVVSSYGYHEIRFPILEKTELFCRSIGEVTDIVEKEMYSFNDRNGDSLTLRPEGTASCVRSVIEAGIIHNQVQKLWYMGPMFRHERPQKGRYRQFYQIGVEVFGQPGPDIDAEVLMMLHRLWQQLGLLDVVNLEINSLGNHEERQQYREVLINYFSQYKNDLDEDSQRRLQSNPLRILDSKNPALADLIHQSPRLGDCLGAESRGHFDFIITQLDKMNIPFTHNQQLVRGLDYYGNTVFEWVTQKLGSQGTICAGGRYDLLVEQLGGKKTPATGFAMGMERLVALLKTSEQTIAENNPHVYMVVTGDKATDIALSLAEQLRTNMKNLNLLVNCGGGSFKSQFKKADKSGAQYALILADDEVAQNKVSLKPLRARGEQCMIAIDQIEQTLAPLVKIDQT